MASDTHAHDHLHGDKCEEQLSAKYAEYIDSHRDALRAKCKQINICIEKLLEGENPLTLINGYDLSLNKTCSLIYRYAPETFDNSTETCSQEDRNDIRDDIEEHLQTQIGGKNVWEKANKCLEDKYKESEETPLVDKICGLAFNKSKICTNYSNVQTTLRAFFNDQIHHLKCTCRALQTEKPSDSSTPIFIGAAVGGVLLLLALFTIGCICYRHQKSSKRKQKAPNVVYVPASNTDNYPVYQEICDDRATAIPPALPMRYAAPSLNISNTSQITQRTDDQGYLEPVVLSSGSSSRYPVPGRGTPGYDAPPEYREKETDDGENGNCRRPEENDKDYGTVHDNILSLKKPVDVLLGPAPAKRVKKDDHQAESHYFIIEKDYDSKTENPSV